jgi:metal-dependent HD superfamily phosphatase/phosphodiesterase
MYMKSPKQITLEEKLLGLLEGKPREMAAILIEDPETNALQDYANTVSIQRLGYNDHGPVHMRKVAINAILMSILLKNKGIPLNLEKEGIGTLGDSQSALMLAAFLHDVGMTVGRQDHEHSAIHIAMPILNRLLEKVYPGEITRQVIIRSLALECIVGHMATQQIHSLEAGILLVADGSDMEKGRARIPMILKTESKVGDIHKYSANAVDRVRIVEGEERPIRINVEMNASVGLFQIEEVLFHKINSSPLKPHIELVVFIRGEKQKVYL